MERILTEPREDWRKKIETTGLVYSTSLRDSGEYTEYWTEDACYKFDYQEVSYLEQTTEKLHKMCVEAAKFLATGAMGNLGLSEEAIRHAQWSLEQDQPTFYGRMDFAFDGLNHAKLLEYNGDTPLSIIETSITQGHWVDEVFPQYDQWNNLHEAFVNRWASLRADKLIPSKLYFAHASDEESGEDWFNTAYLRDTANEAGLDTAGINIQDVAWNSNHHEFRGYYEEKIPAMFKLYPWEDLISETFGNHILDHPNAVQWIEPAWKLFLSNKTLLAALWHLFPNDENLLPSYLDGPNGMEEWIAKPLMGREGSGIIVDSKDYKGKTEGVYGKEGYLWQKWNPLPDFDGNKAVIGSWVVGDKSVGAGIRESDGYVTDYYARFLPNVIM